MTLDQIRGRLAKAAMHFFLESNDDQLRAEVVQSLWQVLGDCGVYERAVTCDSSMNPPSLVDVNGMHARCVVRMTPDAEEITILVDWSSTGLSLA